MSNQKLSDEQRYAIWKVHGKICFYDGEPLEFVDMKVDHLVPESFLLLPADELEAKLKSIGLGLDYDILGYANLVPACDRCNSRKSARTLRTPHIGLLLAITEPLVEDVKKEVRAQIAGRSLKQILRGIANGLDKKRFTADELMEELEKIGLSRATLSDGASLLRRDDNATGTLDVFTQVSSWPSWPIDRLDGVFDAITIDEVARLLDEVAEGKVSGDLALLADGSHAYVVRARGFYVKYALKGNEISILSCHLG